MIVKISVLAIFCFMSKSVKAATIGEIKFGGGQCGKNHFIDSPKTFAEGYHTMKIDLDYDFDSVSEKKAIQRSSCIFTIPIKVDSNERIVVKSFSNKSELKIKDRPKGQFEYEISFVNGDRQRLIKSEWSGVASKLNDTHTNVIKSACGKDSMLRAQLSAFTQGDSQVDLKVKQANLVFEVQTCQ